MEEKKELYGRMFDRGRIVLDRLGPAAYVIEVRDGMVHVETIVIDPMILVYGPGLWEHHESWAMSALALSAMDVATLQLRLGSFLPDETVDFVVEHLPELLDEAV